MSVILTFLHIAFVMSAFGMLVLSGVILTAAAFTGKASIVRNVYSVVLPIERVGGVVIAISALLGLALVRADAFSLTARWLTASYLLFFAGMVVGAGILGPHYRRIHEIANTSYDGSFSETLSQAVNLRAHAAIVAADVIIWCALLYLMVAKP